MNTHTRLGTRTLFRTVATLGFAALALAAAAGTAVAASVDYSGKQITVIVPFSEGGGTDGEDITVHHVPRAEIAAAIADWRAQGLAIDVRLLLLLGPSILP